MDQSKIPDAIQWVFSGIGVWAIGIFCTIIGFCLSSIMFAYKLGKLKARNDLKSKVLQNRYRLIYAPLVTLLLDTHISTSSAILYPYFSVRRKRALKFFRKREIKNSFNALFDKGMTNPTGEIEFGNSPFNKIKEIVQNNCEWADPKMILLIKNAERLQCEIDWYCDTEDHVNLLTDADLKLVEHIWDLYHKLNKKVLLD